VASRYSRSGRHDLCVIVQCRYNFCMEIKQCTFSVFWSAEDDEFVGTCQQFPSLSWLDSEQDKALAGIRVLVETTLVDLKNDIAS